jgi:hypothetical protein
MGTGVGEAMLLGAAMGGGSAALTGGDPLKGALLGGLTGGVGSGIGGALAGGAEAAALTSAATPTATTLAGTAPGLTAGTAGSTLGSGLGNSLAAFDTGVGTGMNTAFSAAPQGLSATGGAMGLNPAAAQSAMQGGTNFALNAPTALPSASSGYALGAPSIAPGGGGIANLSAAAPAASTPANLFADPMKYMGEHKFLAGSSALAGATGARQDPYSPEEYDGPLKRFRLSPNYRPPVAYAEGGIADLGAMGYDRSVGEQPMYPSNMAHGGIANLGSYSDGGRMLRGPGDGMSDSIPASISGKRPARLADGEFVVPADVVSHLGNGSTDAGAKTLYGMMDKVRTARTGRKSQGREINPGKYMPA